jgi:hypothetical protein
LRRVVVWDEKNHREIELLTNHLSFPSAQPPSVKSTGIVGRSNSSLRC